MQPVSTVILFLAQSIPVGTRFHFFFTFLSQSCMVFDRFLSITCSFHSNFHWIYFNLFVCLFVLIHLVAKGALHLLSLWRHTDKKLLVFDYKIWQKQCLKNWVHCSNLSTFVCFCLLLTKDTSFYLKILDGTKPYLCTIWIGWICDLPQPVKLNLNKKLNPKQKTIQAFNIDA